MRYIITGMLIFIGAVAFSQSLNLDSAEVRNSTIEFNGGNYNGYLIELNAPPDIVEDAIKERFKQQGAKPKETKDFMVYRNVVMPLIDQAKPIDAFIKVDRKSKKEKEQAIVYLIATLPGEIPEDKIKSGDSKAVGITAVTTGGAFLTGIVPDVKQSVHNRDYANQQSLVKKEQKKLAELEDEQADLEKKLKKLQSDLEYNKKAQEKQTTEVEKAKTRLSDLSSATPK